MPMRSVKLTDHLDSFVENGVRSGRFDDASEVVREGLRLLERQQAEDEARLAWLRSAAQESFSDLDRGGGTKFHSIDDLAFFMEKTSEELAAEPSHG